MDRYSYSHGYNPFDEVLRTFLVLYDGRGGLPRLDTSRIQARIFDVGPTLLARAGVPRPPAFEGFDLLGESARLPEFALARCYRSFAVRSLAWKLVGIDFPDRVRNAGRRVSVHTELARAFPGQRFAGQLHHVEHHLAHLQSCFAVSPFGEAVAVSVDGFGDFASAAWGVGRGGALTVDGRVRFPHSLGVFYQALTQFLGFPRYGDEYKVMGLAPYGQPRFLPELRRVVTLLPDGGFELRGSVAPLALVGEREKVEQSQMVDSTESNVSSGGRI